MHASKQYMMCTKCRSEAGRSTHSVNDGAQQGQLGSVRLSACISWLLYTTLVTYLVPSEIYDLVTAWTLLAADYSSKQFPRHASMARC